MFEIVASHKERYSSEKREKRRAIADQVIDILLESGAARFLKRVEGETYWAIASGRVAFEKVSHVLRSKKQKVKLLGESRNEAQQEFNIYLLPPALVSLAYLLKLLLFLQRFMDHWLPILR
jgi:hypothetical protein